MRRLEIARPTRSALVRVSSTPARSAGELFSVARQRDDNYQFTDGATNCQVRCDLLHNLPNYPQLWLGLLERGYGFIRELGF